MNFDSIIQSHVSALAIGAINDAIAMVNRAFDSVAAPAAVTRRRGRPRLVSEPRIESMLRDGKCTDEIMQATGASHGTVCNVRRRIGIPARLRGPSRRPRGESKRLIIEALNAGKTPKQIIAEIGCGAAQVSRERRLLGLPPFPRGFERAAKSATLSPADEIGADDHDAIADRVDRGVAELDFTVESVVMDVREQATGGAE